MIEVYAFLAAFALLIPAVSVLVPSGFIRSIRAKTRTIPTEHFAALGIDFDRIQARYLARYRVVSVVIAVVGVLLLAWLSNYMLHTDWHRNTVTALVFGYAMLMSPPMIHISRLQYKYYKQVRNAFPDGKRKATLQRRRLFDFVSPMVVSLAVLAYFLFAGLVIYLRQHPFPGFGGFANLGIITIMYAFNAFLIFKQMYGRKHPLQTQEDRVLTLGAKIRLYVYLTLFIVVFVSLRLTLSALGLNQWAPFSQCVYVLVIALFAYLLMTAQPRKPEDDGFGLELST
ncbi:MAG TPA: hypothetical protein VKB34_22220 [Povalibacter sp.]|nr:hypothetical protein [Povalibacter sp.]